MAFPEDYLHPSEELILNLRPHWFRLVPSGAALACAIIVGLLVFTKVDSQIVSILMGLILVGTVAWFGKAYTSWVRTYFVLTSDRLIHRQGIISRSGIEIPLERINTVFSSQTIFERLIGAGDLVIESASTEGRQEFDDMRKPSFIQNEIYVAMEANQKRRFEYFGQASASAATEPSISIPDQIEQLDALRERGVISEEEFLRKKTELLDRM